VVVDGEEQLLLGAEQPEQVRLRDARLARDRVGRGAAVAALGELTGRDDEDLLAALPGGLAARGLGGTGMGGHVAAVG
jgi:hypothetical protein